MENLKTGEYQLIDIDKVKILDDREPVGDVESLAKSISEIGLLSPININVNNELVAGNTRLEACKLLGWTQIPATVVNIKDTSKRPKGMEASEYVSLELELAEIDENLIRKTYIALKHSEKTFRRKEIYEALHPETKAGVAGGKARQGSANDIMSFAEDTAQRTGVTERTVERDVRIAKNITPEAKELIRDTDVADRKVDLLSIAKLKPAEQLQVAEKIAAGKAKTVPEAQRELRLDQKREQWSQAPAPITDMLGCFGVVYADPPWKYDFSKDNADSIEAHYPTMELTDICDMPVKDIADDDCILFLWATSPKLQEAMAVMAAWGFDYKTHMVWYKEHIAMGYYARQQHELLLIGTRGTPGTPLPEHRPRSVIQEKKTEHSRKPIRFYEIIEAMYPHLNKVELFCRAPREGWSVWGNEV